MLLMISFGLTLIGYLLAKKLNQFFPKIPVIVFSMFMILALISIFHIPYQTYSEATQALFSRLLGYVTVALAIPLACMRYQDLPLKKFSKILIFASLTASALPVGLAYLFHLSEPTILAFTTRSITTPIALNIAEIIHAPATLVTLIVILSGVMGASFSSFILRNIDDERASGLALGLAAHAIGTAQAWQRSPVAGEFATFGMALNGIFTAIWLPIIFQFI